MRFISKGALLALVAVCAMSAVAAASASAHEFLIEGKPIKAGEEVRLKLAFVPEMGGARWQEENGSPIACGGETGEEYLGAGGKISNFEVEYESGCEITNTPRGCSTSVAVSGGGELTSSAQETLFNVGKTPLALVKIVPAPSCGQAGKWEVTGKQKCEVREGAVEKTEHEVVCLMSGSELTAGTRWKWEERFNEQLGSKKKFSNT